MNSADMARWRADVAARRTKYSPDLLAAFLADVATDATDPDGGPMEWPHTTAALQAEEDGLLCDRCGRAVTGISRYPEGWLCDPCVAVVDGTEPDEDYADDVLGEWDSWSELRDDGRRGK